MNNSGNCDECKMKFPTKRTKTIHYLRKHLNAWAPCGYCVKKFQRLDQLNRHVIEDHIKKESREGRRPLRSRRSLKNTG